MQKIILGRAGTQPFEIKGSSVSNEHAEIIIDDNGMWTLKDLDSMNGIFVRDENTGELKRISSISIHPISFICLGTDNSHGCSFYARQVLNPGNYIDELAYMNEKEDEYEREIERLEGKVKRQKQIVFVINILVVLITLIPGVDGFFKAIPEFRLNLMRIVPVASTFFAAFYDAAQKKKKLTERYDRFRHCPNPACSHKMKTSEIRSMDCARCHCH